MNLCAWSAKREAAAAVEQRRLMTEAFKFRLNLPPLRSKEKTSRESLEASPGMMVLVERPAVSPNVPSGAAMPSIEGAL